MESEFELTPLTVSALMLLRDKYAPGDGSTYGWVEMGDAESSRGTTTRLIEMGLASTVGAPPVAHPPTPATVSTPDELSIPVPHVSLPCGPRYMRITAKGVALADRILSTLEPRQVVTWTFDD